MCKHKFILLLFILVCCVSGCFGGEAQSVTDRASSPQTSAPDQTDVSPDPAACGVSRAATAASQDTTEEAEGPPEYPEYLESVSGLFTYYNQTDSRWGDLLFGPKDPIRTHGCGPTALAMLVSSYTGHSLTPDQAAVWAADHGLCVPGEGSSHAIIEKGCSAFGLQVRSFPAPTVGEVLDELHSGKSLVALVGKGYFSNRGHFLILIKPGTEEGTVRIADPASGDNCAQDWPVSFILDQLKAGSYGGGPLWVVDLPF